MGIDSTSDGTFTYSRSPGGRLVGQSDGTTDLLAGLDRHGDLAFLLDPVAGTLTDTRVFDPFGDAVASTGTTNQTLGFQGDYTDPASDEVWMGARWYSGADAVFRSRDTVFGELGTPISLNRYTYGYASPLTYWDPDGRAPGYIEGLDGPPLPGVVKAHAPTSNLEDLSPGTVVTGSDGSVYLRDDAIALFSDDILATIVEEGRIWELISLVQADNRFQASYPLAAGDVARQLEEAIVQARLTEKGMTPPEIAARVALLDDSFGASIFAHRDLALGAGAGGGLTREEVLQLGNQALVSVMNSSGSLGSLVERNPLEQIELDGVLRWNERVNKYDWALDLDNVPPGIRRAVAEEWVAEITKKASRAGFILSFAVDAGDYVSAFGEDDWEGLAYEVGQTGFSWAAGAAGAWATSKVACKAGFWTCTVGTVAGGLAAGIGGEMVYSAVTPCEER